MNFIIDVISIMLKKEFGDFFYFNNFYNGESKLLRNFTKVEVGNNSISQVIGKLNLNNLILVR